MTSVRVPQAGQPIVFRGGAVATMDDAHTLLPKGDVLIVNGKIAEVAPSVASVPDDVFEIDATGGIITPGFVDTHRHMWQTPMRGYGADWTLTQYFLFYYLQYGKHFRPEDVAAGDYISALDAIESGVTTSVDWAHGLQTPDHGEAALEALKDSPGRFVLAYANLAKKPWEWTQDPAIQSIIKRAKSELFGAQIAFDIPGDPGFPEAPAFAVARELDVAMSTHAGVFGATDDSGITAMYENGCMRPGTIYIHAATLSDVSYQRIADTGGFVSLATESECTCGHGYPPTHKLRKFGIPTAMGIDASVWQSADHFAAMRATINTDRAMEHMEALKTGDKVTHATLRCEDVVEWSTRGGAKALGKDSEIGSLEVGKLADVVLLKNDDSPTWVPVINPYGHIVYQAGRGDVHTVTVGGKVVKSEGKLVAGDLAAAKVKVENTLAHLQEKMGDKAWQEAMNPSVPAGEDAILKSPYQYRREGANAAAN
ncbi:amidohydrolase family protein [Paenarthrobacter sp. NPDC089714]|uniref:amidohydrolase family protein n=1 Tax=Paenarthrobacter sp. NPDC089714 TaxID=3364377 RepID=UPI00380B926D